MTKISSRLTTFNKRIFPAIWFGFLAVFVVATGLTGAIEENVMFLVVPIVLAVLGYFLMKKLVWDLVDEVYDCGDSLLIRNQGKEDTIALSNIMNVGASTYMNPPRVSLRLITPGKFGSEIAFSPIIGLTFNPFAKNPVIEDLIVRVHQARSKRGD